MVALACLPAGLRGATNSPLPISAEYYFAGGEKITDSPNLPTFNRIADLPSTIAFQKLAIEKLSALIAARLKTGSSAQTETLLRPLLADLAHAESMGSFGGSSTNAVDFVIAVHLKGDRARVWHDDLVQMLNGPEARYFSEGFTGWRWEAAPDEAPLRMIAAKDWLIVGRGDELMPLEDEYLRQIVQQGRPGLSPNGDLARATLDLPKLAAWLPDLAHLFKLGRVQVTVTAKADHFDISSHVIYPEAIPWTPQPWQIPTQLIRSPLISFTAGQDVAAFLNLDPALLRIDHNPLTNQFCAWALGEMVFQSYMEWPVPNASNALQALSRQAPEAFNDDLKRIDGGQIVSLPERRRLLLGNLRVVVPSLEAAPARAGQFLLLSLFPLSMTNKPPPETLWAQVEGHSDVVCYDWEATGPRLQQWRLLNPLLLHSPRAPMEETIEATIVKENWLNGIGACKGNAVTVITRVAPNELALTRNAPLGLTGLEWVLLSDWISRSNHVSAF